MDAEIDAASGMSLVPTVGKQFGLAVKNVRSGREIIFEYKLAFSIQNNRPSTQHPSNQKQIARVFS